MKKKGFTLIELLAVIVILAIIALIIVPIVSNVIDSSRKAAFKESVNGMIDSTNNYISEYVLNHNDELNEFPVVFTCDGTSCKTSDNYTLTFKGNAPKSGNIIIQRDGVLAEYITDGKYCAYGYKWNLVVENSCGDVDVTKPVITGVKNGKVITLTMTDVGSGVDKYCANTTDTTEGCSWVTPSNPSSEEYTIQEEGTRYFFVRDKKGNISDSINFTTTSNDYCTYVNNQVVEEFSYTGDIQSFTVPSGCLGIYKLEVWGAQGGGAGSADTSDARKVGGKGGYSYGNVTLTAGQTIYIVVGGAGSYGTQSNANGGLAGGYNGGGNGGGQTPAGSYKGGGSGGGATHIGKQNALLKNTESGNVYIVAGGGGGGYYHEWDSHDVGGSDGGAGNSGGGGAYGQGSNGGGGVQAAGGGGGWAGGTTAAQGRASTGGTGYVGGVISGTMVAGNASMPTHDGTSTMIGNGGHGHAKITFISLN